MITEKRQLLLAHFDRASAVLWNQHLVADSHARRDALPFLVESTGAHGDDLGFVELFHGGLGEEEARGGFGFGLYAVCRPCGAQFETGYLFSRS